VRTASTSRIRVRGRRPAGRTARAVRADPCSVIAATAANESQKPGASGAHGSSTVTTPAASASTCSIERERPAASDMPATISIQQVRCAGMPHPARPE